MCWQARASGGDERTMATQAKLEALREEQEKMKAEVQYEKEAAEEVSRFQRCRSPVAPVNRRLANK